MTKKELLEAIKDMPEDAVIYIAPTIEYCRVSEVACEESAKVILIC